MNSLIRRIRRLVSGEGGQMLIMAAMSFVVLAGATALTIDIGMVYMERRGAQNAADSAALAAAGKMLNGGSLAAAISEAESWAEKNGYDDDDVEINIPPQSGPYSGNPKFVEVIVDGEASANFASVLGISAWDVSARAVAGIDSTPKPYSIIVLNETDCNSLELNGNISINLANSGIMVNSNCVNRAIYANGSVSVNTSVNDVVGGWTFDGGAVDFNPMPTNAGKIDDPLAGVPEPAPPAGPARNCNFPGGNSPVTFQPGVYNCALNLSGNRTFNFAPGDYLITGGISVTGAARVNFRAGVYTLRGQGLKLRGNGEIVAEGVTFFIDEGVTDLSGTGKMTITAPASGPYAGIAIFQARDNTNQVEARGTAFAGGKGTVYAKAARIRLVGTADYSNMQLISDKLLMSGTAGLTIDFQNNFMAATPTMRMFE
jgi:hypothetical protein